MNKLTEASRIARAVAKLAIGPNERMAFSIVSPQRSTRPVGVASDVARALGYGVVEIELPTGATDDPQALLAAIGRAASTSLSMVQGAALIVVDARRLDDRPIHRDVLAGAATLARESWSVNGETFLLVVAGTDPIPAARIVGEAIGRTDWADGIAL